MNSFFKKYRVPVIFGLIITLSAGYYSYRVIPVSLFPEITFPKIKIIANNGEQPVDQMMITVTRPLEEAVKQVPELKSIRSTVSRGSCEMSVYLNWQADIYKSQQMIESRIAAIRNKLPAATEVTIEQMNPSILSVMGFSLEGKGKSLIELRQLGEYVVKPYLSQTPGIASVRIQGGKTKEYWIEIDPSKMSMLGIGLQTVYDAIAKTGFIESNGYMTNYRRQYLTLTDATLYNKEDIENVMVQNTKGIGVAIKDIAKVRISEKLEYVKINANGHEGVLVNILKQPNTNILSLANEIQLRMNGLQKLLPAGVTLKPYYDQSVFVKSSIRSVWDALLLGILLAILVTMLFLRSLQANMSILFIIPVTLCATLLVMTGLHYTLNIMTIGAIAASIGLIIDDAVVVIEQIHRTREENPESPVNEHIRGAIKYLLPAMIGSSLSTIVIFIPFSLMSGIAGAYFKVLAYTMIITLACSFIVTSIGLPVLYGFLSTWLPANLKTVHHSSQRKWVDYFIHKPLFSIVFAVLLVTGSIIAYPHLETGFLPEMDEGSIVLDFNSPPGTSLAETDRMLREVDSIVLKIPEVVSYSRRAGDQMGFFITEPNRGDYLIELSTNRKRTSEVIIDDIRKQVESALPALQIEFGQVVGDMLGDLITSSEPIEIKVFGNDVTQLQQFGREITSILEKIQGIADVKNGTVIAGPYFTIKPREKELSRLGLTPNDLQLQLHTMFEGIEAGSVKEEQRLVTIRMIYPNGPFLQMNDLTNAQIYLSNGRQVPLSDVATLEIHQGVAELERENLQPIVAVTARLNGRDLGSVMKEIRTTINSNVHFPQGYGVIYAGAYAEQQSSFKDLLMILILASLLVILVLLILFRNIRLTLIIILISIISIGGAIIALFLTGIPLNVGSYTGIIMIVGIIAENAVFTSQQFLLTLKETNNCDLAINFAIAVRLRPKLMTALSAIIALTPLALGRGTGAQMHQPLAIAVIGGFICGLPLLLIVFPSILRLVYAKYSKES
jgi:CzcA family heavy metal efflux pump